MIDLHCHVLPGIDDGPETLEESVALARVAVDAGIDTLVATPHVNSRTPNDSATIARLVDTLNQRLDEEHVDLEVLPGGEIAISHLAEIEPQELSRLGLGGGPQVVHVRLSQRCQQRHGGLRPVRDLRRQHVDR